MFARSPFQSKAQSKIADFELHGLQMSEVILDDPDFKAHIEQVLMRQRDFHVGTRVMVGCGVFGWSSDEAHTLYSNCGGVTGHIWRF